ncbi:MAG: DUF1667 domain-containing protein [Lacrimispora sp.]|uniref:DUF1667 domain-containing protein n=1 Tax=Lacrimispora sp. TaxID=2719234 RepID=UPI0039E377B1
MLREYVCIMCPRGCEMEAETEGKELLSVTGNFCSKGRDYIFQELTAPKRNIATSVLVKGGELPLASVRLTKPIPREDIFRAMEQIKRAAVQAPVFTGQVVIKNLLGTGSDVIATKNVEKMDL